MLVSDKIFDFVSRIKIEGSFPGNICISQSFDYIEIKTKHVRKNHRALFFKKIIALIKLNAKYII